MSKVHTATLIRGLTYYLGNKKFSKGVPVKVSEDERDILEEQAIDVQDLMNGNEFSETIEVPKFSFSEESITKTEETKKRVRKPN